MMLENVGKGVIWGTTYAEMKAVRTAREKSLACMFGLDEGCFGDC